MVVVGPLIYMQSFAFISISLWLKGRTRTATLTPPPDIFQWVVRFFSIFINKDYIFETDTIFIP